MTPTLTIVQARGRDLPRLVAQGILDAALAGLDALLESVLAGYELAGWQLESSRPTRLCLLASELGAAQRFERVFSEYPRVTTAWFTAHCGGPPVIIPARGSLEGLVLNDSHSAVWPPSRAVQRRRRIVSLFARRCCGPICV